MKLSKAKKIIDEVRMDSPFTMHLTTDEFVEEFRKRYAKIYRVILPSDYVVIAKKIKEIDFSK